MNKLLLVFTLSLAAGCGALSGSSQKNVTTADNRKTNTDHEENISVKSISVSAIGELVNVVYHNDQLFFLSQPYSSQTNQLFKIDLKTGAQTNSQYFESMSNTCNAGTILDFDPANSKLMIGTALFSTKYDTVFDLNFNQINTVEAKRANHKHFVENDKNSATLVEGAEKDRAISIAGFKNNDHWPHFFRINPTVYQYVGHKQGS